VTLTPIASSPISKDSPVEHQDYKNKLFSNGNSAINAETNSEMAEH
jgi:hypothetical protein